MQTNVLCCAHTMCNIPGLCVIWSSTSHTVTMTNFLPLHPTTLSPWIYINSTIRDAYRYSRTSYGYILKNNVCTSPCDVSCGLIMVQEINMYLNVNVSLILDSGIKINMFLIDFLLLKRVKKHNSRCSHKG